MLAPVRNNGGGGVRELIGADENVCKTAAVMQQARDDKITHELGVNLHRSGVADDEEAVLITS